MPEGRRRRYRRQSRITSASSELAVAIVAGILLVFIVVFCITHVFQRRVPPPDQ